MDKKFVIWKQKWDEMKRKVALLCASLSPSFYCCLVDISAAIVHVMYWEENKISADFSGFFKVV